MKSSISVMKDGTPVRLVEELTEDKVRVEFIYGPERGLVVNYSSQWLEPLTRDKYNNLRADLLEKLQALEVAMDILHQGSIK
jgi:hypothetical protein